jgi:4,5-dihydroxyphthalate decarboxylase
MLARVAIAAKECPGNAAPFSEPAPSVVMRRGAVAPMQGETMNKVPLSFACGLYDRMLPLYTGEVAVDGVDLKFLVEDNPRIIFDNMAARQEYDACEFSSSEYISRLVAGQCPFVAIPVFASRVFRHSFIFINRKFIKSPKDLAGKRIGVPLYTMTAAVFIRGLLSDEFGIDFSSIEWV